MGPKRKEEGLQSPQKKAKVTSESGPMARDLIEPLTLENGTFVKIMSWNVNGLRALTDKDDRKEKVRKMLEKYKPDVLCLQETKIQESHVAKLSTAMQDLLPVNYSHYWACSRPPNKLGYAGTAMFIRDTKGEDAQPKQKTLTSFFASSKKDEPASEPAPKPSQDWPAPNYSVVTVKPEPLEKKHIGEGRTIMAEFDSFVLVACYVPNSGQNLVRKDYRVNEWDPAMAAYLKGLEESTGKPVIYTGDMNVGHLNIDIYNAHAKHISKIPGLTPEERASHTKLLECGFVDAFRFFYPAARGQFTWWSTRTFARGPNNGLRLDAFLCSTRLMPEPALPDSEVLSPEEEAVPGAEPVVASRRELTSASIDVRPIVYDSYIVHQETEGISDHCPVMLVLKV